MSRNPKFRSRVYKQLVYNGDFRNGLDGWTAPNPNVTISQSNSPIERMDKIMITHTAGQSYYYGAPFNRGRLYPNVCSANEQPKWFYKLLFSADLGASVDLYVSVQTLEGMILKRGNNYTEGGLTMYEYYGSVVLGASPNGVRTIQLMPKTGTLPAGTYFAANFMVIEIPFGAPHFNMTDEQLNEEFDEYQEGNYVI